MSLSIATLYTFHYGLPSNSIIRYTVSIPAPINVLLIVLPLHIHSQQVNIDTELNSSSCLRRDPRVPPPNSSNCTDFTTGREGGGEFVPVRLPAAALSTQSTPAQQLNANLLSSVVPQMEKFNTSMCTKSPAIASK